jgi:hypothetical protein
LLRRPEIYLGKVPTMAVGSTTRFHTHSPAYISPQERSPTSVQRNMP